MRGKERPISSPAPKAILETTTSGEHMHHVKRAKRKKRVDHCGSRAAYHLDDDES